MFISASFATLQFICKGHVISHPLLNLADNITSTESQGSCHLVMFYAKTQNVSLTSQRFDKEYTEMWLQGFS